jgi:hypothetical protein
MVRAIENWAELVGTVRAVRPREELPQMSELVLAVEEANDVDDYPNLLADAPGRELPVMIETEKLAGIEAGGRVRLRARRGGPETVVGHPDGPSAG